MQAAEERRFRQHVGQLCGWREDRNLGEVRLAGPTGMSVDQMVERHGHPHASGLEQAQPCSRRPLPPDVVVGRRRTEAARIFSAAGRAGVSGAVGPRAAGAHTMLVAQVSISCRSPCCLRSARRIVCVCSVRPGRCGASCRTRRTGKPRPPPMAYDALRLAQARAGFTVDRQRVIVDQS
jgi:hypothetical protein